MKTFIKETLNRPKKGWAGGCRKHEGRMDGGLALHTMECQSGVDWGNTEIVAREREDLSKEKFSKELSHYDRDIAE